MDRADDGRPRRRKRVRGRWWLGGGDIYLLIYPHTRPSLDLDKEKNSGVVEPPKKGEC